MERFCKHSSCQNRTCRRGNNDDNMTRAPLSLATFFTPSQMI
ncbi:hypothetical protein RMSM_04698 [Rhodopirellula maiorica SM1]|uniref:Uncharacterized protein n=1 Tax=Rhodopirellula maiorica SM1 TaxID=1265738 RepID=M5RSL0_9BACT|nr:hypothetical protein RMSM_04698 [Rhodopirellula maiorica SM1]